MRFQNEKSDMKFMKNVKLFGELIGGGGVTQPLSSNGGTEESQDEIIRLQYQSSNSSIRKIVLSNYLVKQLPRINAVLFYFQKRSKIYHPVKLSHLMAKVMSGICSIGLNLFSLHFKV